MLQTLETEVVNSTPANACPACGSGNVIAWQQGSDRFHHRPEIYQLLKCSNCSVVLVETPPSPQ